MSLSEIVEIHFYDYDIKTENILGIKMITSKNFKKVLELLHYKTTDNKTYIKIFNDNTDYKFEFKAVYDESSDRFDFAYPPKMEYDRTTTEDSHQQESFVVFECITRLFDVGYKPENLRLEGKNYQGQKLGWIDILVKDNTGTEYLIIECKTSDSEAKSDEFTTHWNKTLNNGDQLFRYFNTFSKAQYLCMYTADFVNDELVDNYNVITLKDNDEYLESNKKLKSYKWLRENQGSSDEFFEVWKNTYGQDYSTNGIIEEDCKPFDIGKKKISIKDLKEIDYSAMQKKYNEFATILRKYNVSSKENAFDKLVNLFLAKIVDETYNQSELKCLWKGAAYDNYYDMQDRLQSLYKKGMEDFFQDTVAYVENNEINEAFSFLKSNADEAKRTILAYFRTLKYYNNNPFAFLDVHNESLFYQNAVILKEIVNMIQDIKIKTNSQNQFLGDLFEGFLDQGIKQSEGQFFTPMPIVKFLISSLPLETLISESAEIPKVIDYACGAGHFLTEYANQIKPFVEKYNKAELSKYYSQIHGIEKEYRLSKVSQVSAFMYGQDDIKILYKDALVRTPEIKEGTYSVLVANPPYSVKGFLQTLDDSDRENYELFTDNLNVDSNNSIETFFVERAKQLLKPNGIAAIILPSSVLSNGNIYSRCREVIFKYFDIIAIFESGTGTFGKTGTTTDTLFLRKKSENPSIAEHYKNRVETWFSGDFQLDKFYEDFELVEKYCEYIGVSVEDYKTLLQNKPNETLLKNEVFENYIDTLDVYSTKAKSSTITKGMNENAKKIRSEIRARVQKAPFKNLTEEEKLAQINDVTVRFIREIEKEKLYYFMLLSSNPYNVVCVKAPEKSAIKSFLGYEWSDTKGNEGIKYINVKVQKSEDDGDETDDTMAQIKGIEGIQTPMFNPNNLLDGEKINSIIRKNFNEEKFEIPENLAEYVKINSLVNMVDFTKATFEKIIKTENQSQNIEIKSKYQLVKLGDVCDVKIGGTPSRNTDSYFHGDNLWVSISEMNGQKIFDTKEKLSDEGVRNSNVKLIPKGTTLWSFKLSIGKTAIAGKDLYTNEAIAALIPFNQDIILNEYLFHYFNGINFNTNSIGNKVFGKSLNSSYIKSELKIPLPPLDIQKNIVSECEKLDTEYQIANDKISGFQNDISTIIENISGFETKLSELVELKNGLNYTKSSSGEIIRVVGVKDFQNYFSPKMDNLEAVQIDGKINDDYLLRNNDILVVRSNGSKNLVGRSVFIAELTDEKTSFSGFTIRVRVVSNKVLPKFLCYYLRSENVRNRMTTDSKGSNIKSISQDILMNLKILLPPLSEQEKIIKQVNELEEKITVAQKKIDSIPQKRKEILAKWLE